MKTEAGSVALQDRARILEERAARGELPLPPDSASESEEEARTDEESEEETEEGEEETKEGEEDTEEGE
jgi:hypothetical protein